MVEKIPNDNHLHRRVSSVNYDSRTGKCTEGTYLLRIRDNKKEEYLSVDWAERAKLEISRRDPNNPGRIFKIAELVVEEPLKLGLAVDHIPTSKNLAHAGISGKDLFDEVASLKIAAQLAEKSIMR